MHGFNGDEVMERLEPMVQQLRLAEDLDNSADDYSRGMKKKLGLLLAMVHQPRLLVLDEPTDGLDVESTHLFYDLIFATAAAGTTVLFSTHLMGHVSRLCSHAVILTQRRPDRRLGFTRRPADRAQRPIARGGISRPHLPTAAAMTSAQPAPPGFWRTVRILLRATLARAGGRRFRQHELLSARSGGSGRDWNGLAAAVFAVFLAALNGAAGYCVTVAAESGQRADAAAENGRSPAARGSSPMTTSSACLRPPRRCCTH
jgi:energy-coupling factor transporter ATP-binding protein EcfA2